MTRLLWLLLTLVMTSPLLGHADPFKVAAVASRNSEFESLKATFETADDNINFSDFQSHIYSAREYTTGAFIMGDSGGPDTVYAGDLNPTMFGIKWSGSQGSKHWHMLYPQYCEVSEYKRNGEWSTYVTFLSVITPKWFKQMKARYAKDPNRQALKDMTLDYPALLRRSSGDLASQPVTFDDYIHKMKGTRTAVNSGKEIELEINEAGKPSIITFRRNKNTIIGQIEEAGQVVGYQTCRPHDLVYCYTNHGETYQTAWMNLLAVGKVEKEARETLALEVLNRTKCDPVNGARSKEPECVVMRTTQSKIQCSKNLQELGVQAWGVDNKFYDFYRM